MLLKSIAGLSLALSAVWVILGKLSLWMLPLLFVGLYLVFALIAFLFVWLLCSAVDLEKPQEEDSPFYRAVMNLYIEVLVMVVGARIHTEGLEKVPKDGRFLLVCNHLFVADPGVLLHCLPKSQLAFITKQENQSLFLVGKFMHKTLCQPLDRNNDRAALKTILRCIQLLKEDKASIAVFPEGYTSKDGKLHPFRNGVFKIAQKTNVPIVICTIQNTRQIFKNMKKLKKTDIYLHVVDVISPEAYKGMSTAEISDCVYGRMIADLGESFRA